MATGGRQSEPEYNANTDPNYYSDDVPPVIETVDDISVRHEQNTYTRVALEAEFETDTGDPLNVRPEQSTDIELVTGGITQYESLSEPYEQRLKIGCSIGEDPNSGLFGGSGGTLGAFVDLEHGKVGCITSAHALLSETELHACKDKNKKDITNESDTVYQPAPSHVSIPGNKPFGRITSVVYRTGGDVGTGVEAAIISISDQTRYPDDGRFPMVAKGFTEENQLNYTSGSVLHALPDDIGQYTVYKYGAASGLTRGAFSLHGPVKRTGSMNIWGNNCELYNQLEVCSIGDKPFAQPGDSGSLVLLARNGNLTDLQAIGILVGGSFDGRVCYVTPIWEVLKALNLPLQLKRFNSPFSEETDNYSEKALLPKAAIVLNTAESGQGVGKTILTVVNETVNENPHDKINHSEGMIGNSTYVPTRQSIPKLQNIKEDDHWELIGEQIYYDTNIIKGNGSMGVVFEGRYGAGKNKKIAVKKIVCADNEEAKNRYREIAMITNLIEQSRDPNIVDFIHSYTEVNVLYIAFELGIGTLVDYVKERGDSWRNTSRLKPLTRLKVNRGISEGLNYIHNKGVVHRDLKPPNIFIVERNGGDLKAVIGDFGSAKETNGSMYSLTGRTGSLGFIAPEVFTAMSQDQSVIFGSLCNRKSDIFSTGLLFYYTISLGDNAYGHEMTAQMAIQAQNPPTLGKTDQIRNSFAHQSLIECMLHVKPEERPSAKTVLSHPANWPDIQILNYLAEKSDEFENMITTDPSNTAILEDPMLIPNGNWMNNLPPGTQTYLKAYKVNQRSPPLYKGKETRFRSLLRVIRNTNSHYKGYPQNVQLELGDYPEGHVDMWLQVCPKLLMHVVEKLGAA